MTIYTRLFTLLLLTLVFSGCAYHSRDSVRKPSSRPSNYSNRMSEEFVIKRPPSVDVIDSTKTLKTTLVVIDPGHGGEDFGTRSLSKPKYHEKSLNLTTSLALNDYLQKMGYKTYMTRSKDEFIALQRRAEAANEYQADLFVSVHYNSAPAKEADGIEIFYYKSNDDKERSSASRRLASSILSQVITMTHANSRGIKHGNFAVIRETKMPAILIEGGFLTNEEEMAKIKDPAYVKSIAWGIAKGIEAYFENNSKG